MFTTPEEFTEEEKAQLHSEERQEAIDELFLSQFNRRQWQRHHQTKRTIRRLLGPGKRWQVSKMMRGYA